MDSLKNKLLWEEFFKDFCEECKELYKNRGFTYLIPKEEQVRSQIYNFLRKKGFLVEIESDISKEASLRKRYEKPLEFDLRIIDNEDVVIEIKRTTALKGWANDFKNQMLFWKGDIDKLVLLNNKKYIHRVYPGWNEYGYISEKTKKCFILIVYKDDEIGENWRKINDNIKSLTKYITKKFSSFEYIETNLSQLANDIHSKIFIWIEK